MKVLRRIKNVEVFNDNGMTGNKLTIDELDSEPGYYQHVIRPMLAAGHEGELISWLKDAGIIPQTQNCKNASFNQDCKKPMYWVPAEKGDNYEWQCGGCSQHRTIRENSVFHDVKCNLKDAIRAILGWCKGNEMQAMAKLLGINRKVTTLLYNISAKTANKYMNSNSNEWKIGGPGVVVIVSTYPDGYLKINGQYQSPNNRIIPILCLAEVKANPPRYWFQVLSRCNSAQQIKKVNQTALQIIQRMVYPGSVLVTDLDTKVCSYQTLQSLKHLYPVIASTDGLKRHDTMHQSLTDNLELIWRQGIQICEDAQYYTQSQIQNFLVNQLWRQRFKNEAFEMLLIQFSFSYLNF